MQPDNDREAIFLEDQDADRRQRPQPPPQTPGEAQGPGNYGDMPPGEEAGDAGEGSRGGPMKHQGVGPGDPHTGGDK